MILKVTNCLSCSIISFFLATLFVNAQQVSLVLPIGHSGNVNYGDFSPDNKLIVTCSDDKTARVWDALNGRLLYVLNGHSKPILKASFSPDNKSLFTSDHDSTRIWDVQTGTLKFILGGKNAIISPDGKAITTIVEREVIPTKNEDIKDFIKIPYGDQPDEVDYFDQSVKIWDTETGHLLKRINGYASSISYSEDGNFLLINSLIKIIIWDINKSKVVQTLSMNNSQIKYAGYIPGSKSVLSVTDDGFMRIWNSKNGDLTKSIDADLIDFTGLTFSPDGKKLLIYPPIFDFEGKFQIWDISAGKKLYEIDGEGKMYSKAFFNRLGNKIITFSGDDPTINICDATDGKLLSVLSGHSLGVLNGIISPDDKLILTVSKDKTAKVWDIQNGNFKFKLAGHSNEIHNAVFNNPSSILAKSFLDTCTLKIWQISNGKILNNLIGNEVCRVKVVPGNNVYYTLTDNEELGTTVITWNSSNGAFVCSTEVFVTGITDFVLSPDNKEIVVSIGESDASVFDVKSGNEKFRLRNPVYSAKFSPDGKYIATASWFGIVDMWDPKSGELLKTLQGKDEKAEMDSSISKNGNPDEFEGSTSRIDRIEFSPDGDKLITSGYTYMVTRIWDIESSSLLRTLNGFRFSLSHDGKKIITLDQNEHYGAVPKIWNIDNGQLLVVLGDRPARDAVFSPDDQMILTTDEDTVKLWNAENGVLKRTFSFAGNYFDLDWKNQRLLVQENTQLVVYNTENGKKIYSLIAIDSVDYLVLTPDKYYKCSRNAANRLSWRIGLKLYGFEQFDLKYNRPDIVLKSMGCNDSVLISAYYKAYLKRLKKMNFTEDMLKDDYHLPELKIINFEQIPTITDSSIIRFNINFYDSKYKLDRINLWINDVAVFGSKGIPLRDKNIQFYETTLPVQLVKGKNKIQVSVLNQTGAESYKETVVIECLKGKEKPDLYLLAIGESKYKDSRFNLTYAAKDAQDIATLFKNNENYDEVFIKTLLNEQVTRENIMSLKDFINKADINDEVIFFLAGHGVLDDKLDYYFATYDMDFDNPSGRGIDYNDIEEVLDGIVPLKKILLIDACHSGEVEKEDIFTMDSLSEESNDIVFRSSGVNYVPKLGVRNINELNKELFNDLRKGSGATVISSAGGFESAIESGDWLNGLFTYCLINGIKSKEADLNHDGSISLSELQKYLTKKVPEMSKGIQHPTSRIENLEMDYRIW